MNPSPTKAEIRNRILAKRDALDPVSRIEMSLRAGDHGSKLVSFDPGTVISGFFPIRSEIDARPFMDFLRRRARGFACRLFATRQRSFFVNWFAGPNLSIPDLAPAGRGKMPVCLTRKS